MDVVGLLDKYEVACCCEDFVACLDEGVVKLLDKNIKDSFDVDFIIANPLEYLIEEILGGRFIVHHGYMKKIGGSESDVPFCHCHHYKHLMIYQDH